VDGLLQIRVVAHPGEHPRRAAAAKKKLVAAKSGPAAGVNGACVAILRDQGQDPARDSKAAVNTVFRNTEGCFPGRTKRADADGRGALNQMTCRGVPVIWMDKKSSCKAGRNLSSRSRTQMRVLRKQCKTYPLLNGGKLWPSNKSAFPTD
jgi:hypothetical protein